jgi:hypothetical protein
MKEFPGCEGMFQARKFGFGAINSFLAEFVTCVLALSAPNFAEALP